MKNFLFNRLEDGLIDHGASRCLFKNPPKNKTEEGKKKEIPNAKGSKHDIIELV